MSLQVTAVGNLTRDPELRFTNGGKAVCSMGVACSRRYKVGDKWEETTTFVNVTAWETLGENCAATLQKGNRIIVTGRLEQREYTNNAGEKRTSLDITADTVGPDLKWATAQIERIEREKPTAGGYNRDEEPF